MENKVYVILHSWYCSDCSENLITGVYSTMEKAQEALDALFEKEKEEFDLDYDDIIVEKDETSFSIYEDGYFLSNSSSASIIEKVIE